MAEHKESKKDFAVKAMEKQPLMEQMKGRVLTDCCGGDYGVGRVDK
jgi:hypothetical protein